MSPRTLLLCAAGAILASAVFADDIYFPRADGADISSPAAWGGTLPGTTDTVVFTGLTHTVTANADAEFGTLWNRLIFGYSNKLTFDLRNKQPVPTLKFAGYRAGRANSGDSNLYATFRGGIFDFKGGNFGQGTSYYGDGRSYVFSDGAFVTNINNMILGFTSQERLRVELSGGSKVFVGGVFRFTTNKTKIGNDNWIKVTGGSLFQVAGVFAWEDTVSAALSTWEKSMKNQPDGAMFYKDLVEVSGEGSEIVLLKPAAANSYHYTGGHWGGSKLVVTSNATMRVKENAILWSHFTRNNLTQVSEGGRLEFSNNCYGGWGGMDGGDRSNRVEVLSGGTLSVGGTFHLGYSGGTQGNPGNTFLVSNGTFRCAGFVPGCCESTANSSVAESASNQLVVIQGPDAVFDVTGGNFSMFRAPFCEFRVELGATFNPAPAASFGRYISGRHDCTVRASRGGIFQFDGFSTAMELSEATDEFKAWNNRIIAESGGIVTGRQLVVQGRACSLRVDDATVALTNSANALVVGIARGNGGLGTNCVLEVAGANPKVRLGGNLSVNKDSEILFELPAAGYAVDAKPIVAEGNVTLDGTSRVSFVGAEEMFAAHQEAHVRADYVLIENPSAKSFLTDAQVEAMQTELGGDFKVYKRVVDGRNQLVLRVKASRRGTQILIH